MINNALPNSIYDDDIVADDYNIQHRKRRSLYKDTAKKGRPYRSFLLSPPSTLLQVLFLNQEKVDDISYLPSPPPM